MEGPFSLEEIRTIEKEVYDLTNLWNAYMDKLLNSPATAEHAPPAMRALYDRLLDTAPASPMTLTQQHLIPGQQGLEEFTAAMRGAVLGYGDIMFQFAQFCAQNGMLHANLVPCKCSSVQDEDLKKLLDGDYGSGATGWTDDS